jgi:biopolymer transport protein TolQ
MGLATAPIFLQIGGGYSDVIFKSEPFGKAILLILTVLSVVSWTIMIEKVRFFRSSRKETNRFLEVFTRERSLKELARRAGEFAESPEARIAASVIAEIEKGELRSLSSIDKFLDAQATSVISEWESYLLFLATTASISPLLGLLGTVWGIMSSFLSMGLQGSASLFVVGPGIAEALITTVFGLGAAIPAVVGYNYVVRIIRRKEDELTSFSSYFRSRLAERSYAELKEGALPDVDGGDLVTPSLESK